MIDLADALCLIAAGLAAAAVLLAAATRRIRRTPVADIDPTTGERTDA